MHSIHIDFPSPNHEPRLEQGRQDKLLYFASFWPPDLNRARWVYQSAYEGLEAGLLNNPTFQATVAANYPPRKGVFCRISVTKKGSGLERVLKGYWGVLSMFTLGIVPYGDHSGGYIVTYELFIDGDPKKQYQYGITQAYTMWIGLLFYRPSHLNDGSLPTPDLSQTEAFKLTAEAFWTDAHTDGFL